MSRWVALWDRREAPYALALLRILVCAAVLADLLAAVGCDAVALLWAPPPFGAGLALSWLPAASGSAWLLWSCAVVACCLALFGVAYRVTGWLLVGAMLLLMQRQPAADGIDALLRIVLPLLALSRADAAWSFDAWLRRRRGLAAPDSVPAWPRYLLVVQLLWVYFSAAQHRGSSWGPAGRFAAIGNVLSDPHFARFAPGSLHALYPLLQLGTLLTMLFELSAPLYLLLAWLDRNPARGGRLGALVRRCKLRWIWLALGLSLHLGIACTMRIGIFPFAMIALYPAFLHPDELRAWLGTSRHAKT